MNIVSKPSTSRSRPSPAHRGMALWIVAAVLGLVVFSYALPRASFYIDGPQIVGS